MLGPLGTFEGLWSRFDGGGGAGLLQTGRRAASPRPGSASVLSPTLPSQGRGPPVGMWGCSHFGIRMFPLPSFSVGLMASAMLVLGGW